jgi:hypothetical protein
MISQYLDATAIHVFRYALASADMYYSEVEQRDVFLGRDGQGKFGIWGETARAGPSTKVDLCEVFLEYAMYCCSWCNMAERQYLMQDFGERLGHTLARYLKQNPALLESTNPAIRGLEIVFETAGACFSSQPTEEGVCFRVTECPLEDTSKSSGLPNVELALHGINSMCRSVILDINPDAAVNVSSDMPPVFMIAFAKAVRR